MTWLCATKKVSPSSNWSLGGVSFRIEAADQHAARLTQSACTGFRLGRVLSVTASPGIGTLSVRCAEPSFNVSAGRFIRAAPGWRCLSDTQKAWFVFAGAVVVIPRSQPLVEILLSSHRRPWPPELLSQIFGCALHALLQPRGLHFLHGAGLIAPNSEVGVLIVGASGSGKSTLSLRLVTSGWRYLTDDLLLVGATPHGSILAHAFRRNFAVSAEILRRCGVQSGEEPLQEERGGEKRKRWLDPDTIFIDRYTAQCVPQLLIFPRLTGAPESRVEAMTPADALLALLQETPLVSYDPTITRAQVQTLTRLVAQTRAWRLHAGRDLLEDPDRATQLLSSLL